MQQNRFRSITQIEDSHLFIAIELLQGFMFALFIGGNCSFVYQILLLLKVEFACVMNLYVFWFLCLSVTFGMKKTLQFNLSSAE